MLLGRGVPCRTTLPVEELEATFAAIETSELNAFCYLPRDRPNAAAASADVAAVRRRADRREGTRPGRRLARHPCLGAASGPVAELHQHDGRAPARPRRRRAGRADHRQRVRRRQRHPHGAARRHPQPVGSRPHSRRQLAAVPRPPWPAGWSRIATGGDGGGSIRIPAGFTGLVGLKATFGRIPRGPTRRVRQPDRHHRLPVPLGARHRPLVRRVQRPRRP